ncbi:MAG: ribbon-helix-helix domain-containing protein [Alphaproteobacteria bacterium]
MVDINEVLETAEASIFVSLSELKKRNIIIKGNRTSVTLEPQVWVILHNVAEEQKCDIHNLCSFIFERKNDDTSLASAIRVFLISYLDIKLRKKA